MSLLHFLRRTSKEKDYLLHFNFDCLDYKLGITAREYSGTLNKTFYAYELKKDIIHDFSVASDFFRRKFSEFYETQCPPQDVGYAPLFLNIAIDFEPESVFFEIDFFDIQYNFFNRFSQELFTLSFTTNQLAPKNMSFYVPFLNLTKKIKIIELIEKIKSLSSVEEFDHAN